MTEAIFLFVAGYLFGNIQNKDITTKIIQPKTIQHKTYPNASEPIATNTSGCDTIHTVRYYSKESGHITTCQGRLLKSGEKTRIINKRD